jgi:hypothetical protein
MIEKKHKTKRNRIATILLLPLAAEENHACGKVVQQQTYGVKCNP